MANRVLCADTIWTNKDAETGAIVPYHVRHCPNKAKVLAKMPGDVLWTPICGRHENTDRWANYPDMQWRTLDGVDLPKLDVDNLA